MVIEALFRRLPLFKGKARLARLLFRKAIQSKKDILVHGKYNCHYMLPNLTENISFDIFIDGIYEKTTSDFLSKKIPSNGVFLDLGANIGAIALPLLKGRPDIKLVGVEASPWVFKYLQKNVRLNNFENLTLINKALFHEDDKELKFYSPTDKFGKGSLSPVFTQNAEIIKTITIDSIVAEQKLAKVDFIKIDVEGYEYHSFRGGCKLLSGKHAPDIVFEFVDWAERGAGLECGSAQSLLIDYGYTLYKMDQAGCYHPIGGIIKSGSELLLATKRGYK
ncbi:MAG: FkbM family methyltransferase [Agriterribacter sp.]